ncbi:putative zinc-binding metallopeptidase [Pigmentiphaga soli]|uniref:Zinc-binding metallopeptidase n=1 Tax=Pigmentiphaga soli TaxID=1007095 RepID=A0ABP8GE84_9BURK
MNPFFESLAARVAQARKRKRGNAPGKIFHCRCGQAVFFYNTACLNCGAQLGFEPGLGEVRSLAEGPEPDTWVLADQPDSAVYLRCANLALPAACNWLLPANEGQTLCVSCRLNRTIPDLSVPGNGELWRRIESAKRRVVAQLLTLGLPLAPTTQEGDGGLAFDFLAPAADGTAPLTGHAHGLITLNVQEADDVYRTRLRDSLHEPYRTLVGHFRHELGHYYWDRLVAHTAWLEPFRTVFGDERADYAEALKRHYESGGPPDWALSHISNYAASHPWEDWAETWAHYLHMVDTVDTALSFGLDTAAVQRDYEPFTRAALYDPDDPQADAFLELVNVWVELTGVLNELSRSMGQRDFYPFVLPAAVVGKLQFVHRVVASAAGG